MKIYYPEYDRKRFALIIKGFAEVYGFSMAYMGKLLGIKTAEELELVLNGEKAVSIANLKHFSLVFHFDLDILLYGEKVLIPFTEEYDLKRKQLMVKIDSLDAETLELILDYIKELPHHQYEYPNGYQDYRKSTRKCRIDRSSLLQRLLFQTHLSDFNSGQRKMEYYRWMQMIGLLK